MWSVSVSKRHMYNITQVSCVLLVMRFFVGFRLASVVGRQGSSQPVLHKLLEEFVETSVTKSSEELSATPMDNSRIRASWTGLTGKLYYRDCPSKGLTGNVYYRDCPSRPLTGNLYYRDCPSNPLMGNFYNSVCQSNA